MIHSQKINWKEIAIFYFAAVAISAPFRLRILQPELIFPLPYGLSSFYYILRGIGPIAGFFLIFYVLKSSTKRSLSFFGKNRAFSILAAAVIPLGMMIIGTPDQNGVANHYNGLIAGITLFFYSIAEEYGWRGYLQEALAPMKEIQKIFLIGTLWYVWHLNYLLTGLSLQMHLIHYLSLLAGAWGLLKITGISSSILFASAVHLSFNLMADAKGSLNERLSLLGVAVFVWVILLRKIRKTETANVNPESTVIESKME